MTQLKTEFPIYRNWDEKMIEKQIEMLVGSIEGFTKLPKARAIWTDSEGDCVFIRNMFGKPATGDKVKCSEMKEVVVEWLKSLAEWMQDEPTINNSYEDDDDDGESDEGEKPKADYAYREFICVIDDCGGDSALRISMREMGEDGIEEHESLFFVAAEGINFGD